MTPELMIKNFNDRVGNLNEYDGINCELCNNKGIIYKLDEQDYEYVVDCKCNKERKIIRNLKSSGLYEDFKIHSFTSFKEETQHHKAMKAKALVFIKDKGLNWFFIGGKSGSGKTHICTAISKELIRQGNDFIYLPFARVMPSIAKDLTNYTSHLKLEAEYQFEKLKNAEVLYIDDFLKIMVKDIVFELIDYRYKNKLKTIISSELNLEEIAEYDEAVSGRIYEMTGRGKYSMTIANAAENNYRFHGGN